MVDVAEAQGLRIDGAALAESIGMPVVPIQANKGRGLDNLKRAIGAAAETGVPVCRPVFPDAFEREVAVLGGALGSDVPDYLVRRLLLDVGGYTEKRLQGQGLAPKFSIESLVIEAGPSFFDAAVKQVAQGIDGIVSELKKRDSAPYVFSTK